jgi:hypothetical protein
MQSGNEKQFGEEAARKHSNQFLPNSGRGWIGQIAAK